jgi:hypothetical protein
MRVSAHAMREEETDLSFAEFGGSKRLYPVPTPERGISETGNYARSMSRREGFASELCSRCASPAQLAREEESQPEEDQ